MEIRSIHSESISSIVEQSHELSIAASSSLGSANASPGRFRTPQRPRCRGLMALQGLWG